METYTIAEAARLVGTSRGKLYQAIRTGQLQPAPGAEPGQAMAVTRTALRAAGFPVPCARHGPPPTPAPPPAAPLAPAAEAPPALAPPEAPAPEVPLATPAPARAWQEQALIAHLERALEQAGERERRLLDIVARLTGPRSAPLGPAAPEAPPPVRPPAAAPRAAAAPPLSGLRQQIVAILQHHPEGLAPKAVRSLLQVEQDVRSTMKGMVRSGILTRLEAGRYVVAAG